MSHPESCTDATCTLTYREHLLAVNISGDALPTRAMNRTPGHADEPIAQTKIREKRWDRDEAAFMRLRKEGVHTKIDGAAARERMGETMYDMTERPLKIDYTDAS